MKICEIFSGKSLKKDLPIDTTFAPCYFSWDSPFKVRDPAKQCEPGPGRQGHGEDALPQEDADKHWAQPSGSPLSTAHLSIPLTKSEQTISSYCPSIYWYIWIALEGGILKGIDVK